MTDARSSAMALWHRQIRSGGIVPTVLLALAALAVCGCADVPLTPIRLVDHNNWKRVPPAEDPYFANWPKGKPLACAPYAFQIDGWVEVTQAIEIDTGVCNFITLWQPTLLDVRAGEPLKLVAWHDALTPPPPPASQTGNGHMAVQLGETLLWEVNVEIPHSRQSFVKQLTAAAAVPAGTPLYVHVHNHGSNTWDFQSLAVLRACGRDCTSQ